MTANPQPTRAIVIPPEIEAAMAAGGTLALSVSGGKDGEAMTNALLPIIQERGWKAFLLHMDLGRAEWPQTPAHVERIAERTGLSLVVVKRPQGDLVQEIEDRMVKLAGTDKPFWPSSASRYCTADQKRAQADKVYRNLEDVVEQQEAATGKPFWPSAANRYCTSHHKTNQADKVYRQHEIIISCEGIRAQESPARAKKPQLQIREQITAKALQGLSIMDALAYRSLGQRLALTWFPILDWELEDVWQAMGTSSAELERRRELYKAGDEIAALERLGSLVSPEYLEPVEPSSMAGSSVPIDWWEDRKVFWKFDKFLRAIGQGSAVAGMKLVMEQHKKELIGEQ